MNYGIGYKGSKNAIAEWIVSHFPPAEHLYDLFAGGCSITHAAFLSGKFREIHANDLQGDGVQLFLDAAKGKYRNEKRWISRDDFFALKDTDSYVRYCWSFGNNGDNYLFNEETENLKKHAWSMIVEVTKDGRLKAYRAFCSSVLDYVTRAMNAREKYRELSSGGVLVEEAPEGIARKSDWIKGQNRTNQLKPLVDYFFSAREASGLSMKVITQHLGNCMASHYFTRGSQWSLPTREAYARLQDILPGLTRGFDELKEEYELIVGEDIRRLQSLQSLQSLEKLQSLQSLERLEKLQSLQSLERLECIKTSKKDYREVEIEPNSVVYCDPPYKGTGGYGMEFDHEAFYDWCRKQESLTIISEYAMPEDFIEIASKAKSCSYSSKGVKKTVEKLFVPPQFAGYVKPGELF